MKNEYKLEELLELIKNTCLKNDLRLGQLMVIINQLAKDEGKDDLFYLSNEKLISYIDKIVQMNNKIKTNN